MFSLQLKPQLRLQGGVQTTLAAASRLLVMGPCLQIDQLRALPVHTAPALRQSASIRGVPGSKEECRDCIPGMLSAARAPSQHMHPAQRRAASLNHGKPAPAFQQSC